MHLFVDNLTNVDFSYLHPTRGLVGETWLASIVLEGALDEQGMVCDFGVVKKTVRNWLDASIDHSLVVAKESTQLIQQRANDVSLTWRYGDRKLECTSPLEAITFINSDMVTPDSVAHWCIGELRELLPQTIDRIQLRFEPETGTGHFYHYSHGLKKHAGNCQRIAHGHRSTIKIYRQEERDHTLEQQWCARWQDIYIGSQDDLLREFTDNGTTFYEFRYVAQQGNFVLVIPAQDCYLIPTDSTVELIAQHIANTVSAEHSNANVKVHAYEGIGKGAVAFA
jgi:6-pyruvoyl-tetrahydropterin synthase